MTATHWKMTSFNFRAKQQGNVCVCMCVCVCRGVGMGGLAWLSRVLGVCGTQHPFGCQWLGWSLLIPLEWRVLMEPRPPSICSHYPRNPISFSPSLSLCRALSLPLALLDFLTLIFTLTPGICFERRHSLTLRARERWRVSDMILPGMNVCVCVTETCRRGGWSEAECSEVQCQCIRSLLR